MVLIKLTERCIESLETPRRQNLEYRNLDWLRTQLPQCLTELSRLVRSTRHQHPASREG